MNRVFRQTKQIRKDDEYWRVQGKTFREALNNFNEEVFPESNLAGRKKDWGIAAVESASSEKR